MESFIPDLTSARTLVVQAHQNGTPAKGSVSRFINTCEAITGTLSNEHIKVSPISVFAATTRGLIDAYPRTSDPASDLSDPTLRHLCGGLLRLLIAVIPRVPSGVLSSQQSQLLQPLIPLLRSSTGTSSSSSSNPMRSSVLCASALIKAAPAAYSSALLPLLTAVALPRDPLSPRQQRVRDAASDALLEALGGPSKGAAAQAIAEQAAAALRVGAQVPSAVALLGKTLSALPGAAGLALAPLLALAGGRFASQAAQDGGAAVNAVQTFEALIGLVEGAQDVAAAGAAVVEKLLGVWPHVQEQGEVLGAYCVALHRVVAAVHRADKLAGYEALARVLAGLMGGLALESDDLAACVLQPMRAMLRECLDSGLLSAAAAAGPAQDPAAAAAFGKVKGVLAGALDLRYGDAGLSRVFALFVTLARIVGSCARKLIAGELVRLCNLYELEDFDARDALAAAVGAIVEAVGAEEFVACVPLNLTAPIMPPLPSGASASSSSSSSAAFNEYLGEMEEEEGNEGEGEEEGSVPAPEGGEFNRHWVLPVLAKRMGRAPLELFVSEFYPAAKRLEEAAAASTAAGYEVTGKNEWNRHMQLWELFPCCCRTARTAATAFPRIAKVLGTSVKDPRYSRPICKGLTALVAACKREEKDPASAEEAAEARAAMAAMGKFSVRFLPCLFNTLSATAPAQRAPVMAAIGAYLSVTTPTDCNNYFKMVVGQLLEATTAAANAEGANGANANANANAEAEREAKAMTLMDLAVPFVEHLNVENIGLLLRVVTPLLDSGNGNNANNGSVASKALQKHCWKVVEAMCGRSFDAKLGATFAELLTTRPPAAYAKKMWLRCVASLVRSGGGAWAREGLVAAVLPGVILGVKDSNSKTRTEAFETVVQLAEAYGDGLESLCTLMAAGLGGKNPHMIAATVVALAQVLYKFADRLGDAFVDDLIRTLNILLLSEAPEIVKAVIQFYKTSLSVVPLPQFEKHLADVLTNLVKWTKAHPTSARREARHLFERLLRKYGFPKISALVPEDTRKVLNNIRKTKERRRKRREELLKSGALAKKKKAAKLTFEKTLDMSDLDTEEEEEEERRRNGNDDDDEYDEDGYGYDDEDDDDEEEEEEEMLYDDYDDGGNNDEDDDEDDVEGMFGGKKRKRSRGDDDDDEMDGYRMMGEDNDDDDDDMMAMFDMRKSDSGSGIRRKRGDDDEDDEMGDDIDDRYMDMLAPRGAKRAAGDGAVARKRRKQNDGGRVEVNADGIIVVNEPEDEEGGVKIPKKRLQQMREQKELFAGLPFGEEDEEGRKEEEEEEEEDEMEGMSEKKRSKAQAAKGRSEMYQRMLERREKMDNQKRNAKNAQAAKANAKYSGDMYKATKGKGDIKKTGANFEPFAYIPLNPKALKQ